MESNVWERDSSFPINESVWYLFFESGYYVVGKSAGGDWYAGWNPEADPAITDDTFSYFDTWQAARKYCESLTCHLSFAPPVESRVPGLVTTPLGASPLAGLPDCVPVTMSGDAWESAANHVIAIRDASRNAHVWQQIGSFLQDLCKRPEPCLFPQPQFVPPASFMWTGCDHFLSGLRDEFCDGLSCHGSIDASLYVPQGSLDTLGIGSRCPSFGQVLRG